MYYSIFDIVYITLKAYNLTADNCRRIMYMEARDEDTIF